MCTLELEACGLMTDGMLQTNLTLINLQEGDYLDFALDPKGADSSLQSTLQRGMLVR